MADWASRYDQEMGLTNSAGALPCCATSDQVQSQDGTEEESLQPSKVASKGLSNSLVQAAALRCSLEVCSRSITTLVLSTLCLVCLVM